jgi:hypothetical protein
MIGAAPEFSFSPEAVFALRKAYWAQGYRPLEVWNADQRTNDKGEPLNSPGKQPRGRWREDAGHNPPRAAANFPDPRALNTGVLCGADIVGVDVDVLDQAVADQIVHAIERIAGTTPLTRVGCAPKILLAYRPERPFAKLQTPQLHFPDGTKAKVEILAEGQQFISDGLHPDTGEPYRWMNGSPADTPVAELPVLSEEQARQIIAEAELLLRGAGAKAKDWRSVFGLDLASLADGGVSIDDFYAYMPMHNYIFAPTRTPWPAASVNSRIPPQPIGVDKDGKEKFIPASAWLDQNKPVELMTWVPGLPVVIEDKLIFEGGWIDRPCCSCFNLYHPPTIIPGNAAQADKWLDHVRYVFPAEADHILDWFAHRVQRPQEKINHALVLGGAQGIGKDTLLEPVKYAVGPWNFQEVSPTQIPGRFNGFLKSVILRVSEARDLGEFDRFQLYDHMKAYTAAPPDVLRIYEKHLREHSIVNCCGVIITTNHKTDGIFLPADDRRHYIVWSDRTKEDAIFQGGYWDDLWNYYCADGMRHVAAFLLQRDISGVQPQGTASDNAGVLGHRRRQPHARRIGARRRVRQTRQSGRRDAFRDSKRR